MAHAVIRDAVVEDAARLVEIYAWYVKNTAISFEYEVPSLEEFQRRILTVTERYPYLVAEQEGKILGYAYAGPFINRAAYDWSCELSIYVDRAFVKQGLGRLLYEAMEARLAKMGIQNLYACIAWPTVPDVYVTRNSAEFHAHMGFKKAGEFHKCGCKFGHWYDMIYMEKVIGPHEENPEEVIWGPH